METNTLPKLFVSQANKLGNRVALREKEFGIWKEITWNSYLENVRAVCLALYSLGMRKGDTASILSANNPEWLYTDLGIMSLGGLSAGIYPTNPSRECKYILENSDSKFVFVGDEEQLDKIIEIKDDLPLIEKIILIETKHLIHDYDDPKIMTFKELLDSGHKFHENEPSLFMGLVEKTDPEEVAILIYTSGTTGPPKGSMLHHSGLIAAGNILVSPFDVDESWEIVSYLPLCHAAERCISLIQALQSGYIVNFAESLDTVNQNLQEVKPTYLFFPPRMWEKAHARIEIEIEDCTWFKRWAYRRAVDVGRKAISFWKEGKKVPLGIRILHYFADLGVYRKLRQHLGMAKCKVVLSGAAPIAPEMLEYFHSINIKVGEGYGQTEACGPISVTQGDRFTVGTAGMPYPGVKVELAEDGEVLAAGPNIFKGYYKNPEATANVLKDGWLHTGDIGEMDENGVLRIVDRKRDIIKTSGGKRISPQYIENQLKFSPYIEEAVVIGDMHKYLTALIMIDEETVGKYALDQKIPYSTYSDLSQHQQINELVLSEIKRVNKNLSRAETIKKFTIVDKKFREEDEEITPTMKVKRKMISELYKDVIEAMYTGRG
ncbi:AMP-dependent synthetase/ligase [Thermodesulfobacteriota bacterium]